MTKSRKGKEPERGNRPTATGKRKLEVDDGAGSERITKQSRSLKDLFSSQQSNDSEDPPRDGRRQPQTPTRPVYSVRSSEQSSPSFATMYTFTSSRAQTNGLIDLTSSPTSDSPKRKPSFSTARVSAFNPHQEPKKLVVKNLRTTPRIDPQQYFDRVWEQEDKALDAIFRDEKEPYSLEELYKGAENVCRQGKAAPMYGRLRQKLQEHLATHVKQHILTRNQTESDIEILQTFVKAWSKWQKHLLIIRQIFYYMDQTYLLRSAENPSLLETGLLLFKAEVFHEPSISKRITSGAVSLIDVDRKNRLSEEESQLLRQSIDTFHDLSIYSSDFEPAFKIASEKFFRFWRDNEAQKHDLGVYVAACSGLLEREMTRCDMLGLDRTTRGQMSELIDLILIEEEVETLTLEDSLLDLFEADKYKELEQTYTLLLRRGHVEKIGPTFDKYTETEGTSIVFDEKNESSMVVNLLELKKRLDHFSKFSFHNNETIANGLHKAFELFINKTQKSKSNWDTDNAKPGEMIAKHVDLLLKGGVKAIPSLLTRKSDPTMRPEDENDFDEPAVDEDAEISQHLSNALDLFRFVHGKAVFEAFYKKDLARRLLLGRSASFDAERNMLTRLKNECGASFTHNLESMFKDMDLAREEMMSYNQLLEDRGTKTNGPDLSVNVLSAAAWPTYPDVPVNIPTGIAKVMADFENHYNTKHNGRKLTWKHSLAHCQLKTKFAKGNKEIVVSGFQAIVLLLFNDTPAESSIPYNEIRAACGLPDVELRRTLQSLACGKYRVLLKTPKGREVNETDTFSFNANFTDPKMRIKINQIQLKETKEENKDTHERVAADRHYETQAAIVRIMKSRKKIGHNELIVEVIKATRSRGVMDQADIKKNIEKLIEKDYMERTDGNNYAYVA